MRPPSETFNSYDPGHPPKSPPLVSPIAAHRLDQQATSPKRWNVAAQGGMVERPRTSAHPRSPVTARYGFQASGGRHPCFPRKDAPVASIASIEGITRIPRERRVILCRHVPRVLPLGC